MNINSIVNQINNAIQQGGSQNISEGALKANLQNGSQLLSSEAPGSVISGKIISLDGNDIVLSLGPNAMVNAKLEGSLIAQLGQNVSFIVNNQGNGKYSLSPLFENTNQSNTVNSALKAAGLPETPENQYMVKSMMQEGLSIDKQSLYNMAKAVSLNPDAEVLDLCKMTRLNIPTEPEMVQQFKNYCNFEHEVVNALKDISDSLSLSLPAAAEEISHADLEFVKNSLEILLKDTPVLEETLKEEVSISQDKDIQPGNEDTAVLKEEGSKEAVLPEEKTLEKEGKGLKELPGAEEKPSFNENIGVKEGNSVLKEMRNLEFSPSVLKGALDGSLTKNEFLKSVIRKIDESVLLEAEGKLPKESKEALKSLLDSDVFKDALKQKVVEKFSLEPREVGEEGKVSRLYERLSEQIKSLSDSVNLQGKGDTPFANSVNNLNSNVDFMNQLNQTFNYVQIPLKMNGQDSTGELYVYTNKKKLAESDGNVSALLHLDMDNLGPVDVHVTLNSSNNVRTKFMLKDDAALDLIEQNIHILNERLEKRGYNMSCEFAHTDEPKSIMDTIIESGRNISVISSGSFDARA